MALVVMKQTDLMATVLESGNLPELPTVALKLVALTAKSGTSFAEVAALIELDELLARKILDVSNSSFYKFTQRITSIQQAVSMLGINAVRGLVLSFAFLSLMNNESDSRFDAKRFWQRSLAAAALSKLILSNVPNAETKEIFISALLQNLGELILASVFPEEYFNKLPDEIAQHHDQLEAERTLFGEDHCFVGHAVGLHWKLPPSMLLPVLYHHNPFGYTGDDELLAASTRAIYLSDLLMDVIYSGDPETFYQRFKKEAGTLLDLDLEHVKAILEDAPAEIAQVSRQFDFEIEEIKPIRQILQEARIRARLLNADYEQLKTELIASILAVESLEHEIQLKDRLLKELPDTDGLTGVYNNRFFQTVVDKELSRSIRHKFNVAIIITEIDELERIGSVRGHLARDYVMVEYGQIMATTIRSYDTLARHEGMQYILILPQTQDTEAAIVVEKFRTALEKKRFSHGGKEFKVNASFGIAGMKGSDKVGLGKADLIRRAEKSLAKAQKEGGAQVVTFATKKTSWFNFN